MGNQSYMGNQGNGQKETFHQKPDSQQNERESVHLAGCPGEAQMLLGAPPPAPAIALLWLCCSAGHCTGRCVTGHRLTLHPPTTKASSETISSPKSPISIARNDPDILNLHLSLKKHINQRLYWENDFNRSPKISEKLFIMTS